MRDEHYTPYRKRIFLVAGDLATTASGPNVIVRRLAAWLVHHGYDVTVVGTWRNGHPSVEELSEFHGNAKIILYRRFLKETWHFAPGTLWLTFKLLFSSEVYIVDAHSVWLFNALVLTLAAKLRRQSYFFTLHGNLRSIALGKNRNLKRIALKLFFCNWLCGAKKLFALNKQEAEDALQILPDATIQIISNGINPHPSALTSSREKYALFLGRIDPIKNIESLIEGFALVNSAFPEWELRIVGPATDPQYLNKLKFHVVAAGLEDRVIFCPPAYDAKKEAYFLSASIFALTSWSEGQPYAVLEAMAHGLPVVISDQCNIEVPESCGRVCGATKEKIGSALAEIISLSEDKMTEMRYEAIRFIKKEFSEDRVFSERLSAYFS